MTRLLPLALVQSPAVPDNDLLAFGTQLERLVHRYSDSQLFVYPELHLNGTGDGSLDEAGALVEALAEHRDGDRDRMLAQIAGDLKIWLVPGSFYERGDDGLIYNTTAAFSPEGRRVASYRKVFPWRPYEKVAGGNEFVVFDMDDFGCVGLSICYDTWFPEASRHLAWMGAELILNVVMTPTSDRAQEVTLNRANAIVNQVFVASVNAAAPDGLGRSLLVDPQGRVRVESTSSESTVLTDVIDLDEVAAVRRHGTGGVTRPWQQYEGIQGSLPLPLYGGSLDPERWQPRRRADQVVLPLR
jgi:predicted amidohydrolase